MYGYPSPRRNPHILFLMLLQLQKLLQKMCVCFVYLLSAYLIKTFSENENQIKTKSDVIKICAGGERSLPGYRLVNGRSGGCFFRFLWVLEMFYFVRGNFDSGVRFSESATSISSSMRCGVKELAKKSRFGITKSCGIIFGGNFDFWRV